MQPKTQHFQEHTHTHTDTHCTLEFRRQLMNKTRTLYFHGVHRDIKKESKDQNVEGHGKNLAHTGLVEMVGGVVSIPYEKRVGTKSCGE